MHSAKPVRRVRQVQLNNEPQFVNLRGQLPVRF